MKKPDYFIALLHKQLSGQLTEEETQELEQWLEEKEEHRQLGEEIRFTWELAGKESLSHPLRVREEEMEQELRRFHQHLKEESRGSRFILPALSGSFWTKASAVLLMVLLSAGAVFLWEDREKTAMAAASFRLREGQMEAVLPDSSVITTNHHSTLSLLEFDTKRAISFSGEAFFEIRSDARRPFYIHLEAGRVKVVGTAFVIRAYPGEPLKVSVLEGQVEVGLADQFYSLEEGEQLKWVQGGVPEVGREQQPNLLAWKTRELMFARTPLSQVLPVLESYYGIRFRVSSSALLNCRFTGSFQDIPLEELLEIISYSLDLRVEELGEKRYKISGKGCKGGGA
ncbi:FecR family protein [Nafulsella turpanensis]|uniref:FecR family protein n=1 Tax=Nafulsella turpanensis TaxID=1265690 RepID=UPI00034B5380|nr:FecR domain-containing protein [Nafulsella turpanensis]